MNFVMMNLGITVQLSVHVQGKDIRFFKCFDLSLTSEMSSKAVNILC